MGNGMGQVIQLVKKTNMPDEGIADLGRMLTTLAMDSYNMGASQMPSYKLAMLAGAKVIRLGQNVDVPISLDEFKYTTVSSGDSILAPALEEDEDGLFEACTDIENEFNVSTYVRFGDGKTDAPGEGGYRTARLRLRQSNFTIYFSISWEDVAEAAERLTRIREANRAMAMDNISIA